MTFSPAQVEQLLRPVNPRRVQKDNHGMSHLAAYDVSAHLTRIFGFGGWSKHILSLELVAEDAVRDEQRNRLGWYVTYRCTMRLEIGDEWGGWSNEDGATGSASNLPDRGDAHDFALKNAISYALKRCAKDLGDQFGLSLYNKGSTAALIGRTLAGLSPQSPGSPSVDHEVPDLAPDWDEQPPGRADGLPCQCGHLKSHHISDTDPPGCSECRCGLTWNRDGSLSRSQTTDEEKDRAGVMTAGQQAEHTALQPKAAETRGKVTRIRPGDDEPLSPPPPNHPVHRNPKLAADPWVDQPAGHPDMPQEDRPGTIDGRQQRAIMARLGTLDRAERLGHIIAIVGRDVNSTNELSWQEAAKVLAETEGAK